MFPLKSLASLLLGLLLLWALAGSAQNALPYFKPYTGVAVEKGTGQQSASFAGGLSAAQFAMADLDRDGKSDLVVFSAASTSQNIRTFLNKGTAGNPKWVFAPRFAAAFPTDVTTFLKLLDYNCDGIPDLFDNSGFPPLIGRTVKVRRGYYNSSNELHFTLYKELYYSSGASKINVYVGSEDEPGIADVDGDGDLDIVTYNSQGGAMHFYRNYRAERGLPCDSIQLELESTCWGLVGQGTQRSLQRKFRNGCSDNSIPIPSLLTAGQPAGTAAKTLHGNNTICLLDIDGDGDLDVLNSNRDFQDMQLQVNGKSGSGSLIDSIVAQDTLWQKGGKKVLIEGFSAAYFLDIDGDGKKDIVVAPRTNGGLVQDRSQVWFYRNTGTAAAPAFVFQKDSLLVEDMIDGGSNSHPLFYDFNKDGKVDILMGSTTGQGGTGIRNQLHYYQNVTAAGGPPVYRFVTDNLAGVANLVQRGCVPAVGDLDGDGKDDLLIGLQNGQFAFYKSMAATDTSQPVWTLKQNPLKNADGTVLQIGDPADEPNAAPFIYDMDKDGLPDIAVGSKGGRLSLFKNTNLQQGVTRFAARKDSMGGPNVVTDPFNGSLYRYSTPYIGPIDSTGEIYLVMGGNSGYLYAWSGVGSGNLNATYTLRTSDFSGIRMSQFSAPAFGDAEGNGKPQLLVGNSWGGLFLYRSEGTVGIARREHEKMPALVSLFPNPATTSFTLQREGAPTAPLSFTLCNLVGQELQRGILPAGIHQITLPTAALPAGLYLVRIWGTQVQQTLKLLVTRP